MPNPITDKTHSLFIQSSVSLGSRGLSIWDEVSVKVLESLGSGRYLVSFRGVKVTAQSSYQLIKGENFSALIEQSSDGKIMLKAKNAQNIQPASPQNQSLAAFLYSQGLNADSTTEKIVQQMIQSGIRLSKLLIRKARTAAAEAAAGNSTHMIEEEDTAGEIAALLLEKGLRPSKETIESVMLTIKGKRNPKKQERHEQRQEQEPAQDTPFFDELYKESPRNNGGLLAVLNQLKSKETTGKHWIFLPYSYELNEKEADGLIRILIDFNTKRTEKVLIDCNAEKKRYCFTMRFDGVISEVKYCTTPALHGRDIHAAEERLSRVLKEYSGRKSFSTVYSNKAYFDGLCSESDFMLPIKDFTV